VKSIRDRRGSIPVLVGGEVILHAVFPPEPRHNGFQNSGAKALGKLRVAEKYYTKQPVVSMRRRF